MPTGYTTDIYNGKDVTFKDFALKCARAFGACIHQREDNIDDLPKLKKHDTACIVIGKSVEHLQKSQEGYVSHLVWRNFRDFGLSWQD